MRFHDHRFQRQLDRRPPPKSLRRSEVWRLRVNIEHRDPELREELLVTKSDGAEDCVVFVCCTTSAEGNWLLNGSSVRGKACWAKHELVIETRVEASSRQLYFCDCWSLSADRRTLVMEHRNDALAGQRVVFERSSQLPVKS